MGEPPSTLEAGGVEPEPVGEVGLGAGVGDPVGVGVGVTDPLGGLVLPSPAGPDSDESGVFPQATRTRRRGSTSRIGDLGG
jgi:hypothetical protein